MFIIQHGGKNQCKKKHNWNLNQQINKIIFYYLLTFRYPQYQHYSHLFLLQYSLYYSQIQEGVIQFLLFHFYLCLLIFHYYHFHYQNYFLYTDYYYSVTDYSQLELEYCLYRNYYLHCYFHYSGMYSRLIYYFLYYRFLSEPLYFSHLCFHFQPLS